MDFRILGALEVADGNGRLLEVPQGRPRALLADLIVNPNRALPTHRIIQDLWMDEAPSNASNAVHVYVSNLRKSLASDHNGTVPLETVAGGYRLNVGPGELDYGRFEAGALEGVALYDRG